MDEKRSEKKGGGSWIGKVVGLFESTLILCVFSTWFWPVEMADHTVSELYHKFPVDCELHEGEDTIALS